MQSVPHQHRAGHRQQRGHCPLRIRTPQLQALHTRQRVIPSPATLVRWSPDLCTTVSHKDGHVVRIFNPTQVEGLVCGRMTLLLRTSKSFADSPVTLVR